MCDTHSDCLKNQDNNFSTQLSLYLESVSLQLPNKYMLASYFMERNDRNWKLSIISSIYMKPDGGIFI